MARVVTDVCIRCKHMDCVEVCPVDSFHKGADMLAINPEVCIDCGACELACTYKAIHADTSPGMSEWAQINQRYAKQWPHMTPSEIHQKETDS